MRKKLFHLISLWVFLLFTAVQSVSAAAPGMNAGITKKNVLALIKEYDKDGSYLLQYMSDSGDPILDWWQGCQTIVEGIDTAVHEEFHGYSFLKAPWKTEDIYIGNKKYIRVRYTDVFQSKKMAFTIPKKLRTSRWTIYVGKPMANLASNVNGIYGLLNEYTAYYWGMKAQMSLFDYYKSNRATPQQWKQFINECANDRLAYAEFKYFMMQYLAYAREHSSSVYNGIIHNETYIRAYQTIEKKFASLITKFEKRMQEIEVLLEAQGHEVKNGDYYIIDGTGISLFQEDYDNLLAELEKPVYKNILKGSASAGQTSAGKVSITSLSKSGNSVKLSWKKASGVKGYYVYRKADGEKKFKKVKTTSGTSWTDKAVKKGKKYSYKIVPYTKNGSKIKKGQASAVKSLRI